MFRNFNKLIPCKDIVKYKKNINNKYDNKFNEIFKTSSERWRFREFKITNNPVIQSYSLIVPNDKHYKK